MEPIAVDCRFETDDSIRVKQIELNGRWQPVEQGRQWLDEDGRHILIMLPGDGVRELMLSRTTLHWELYPAGSAQGGRTNVLA